MNVRDLGDLRVQVTRERDNVAAEIAEYTGVSIGAVRRRLSRADGRRLIRNVFEREWPTPLQELGLLRVTEVTSPERIQAIADATAITTAEVRERLESARSGLSIREVFADRWPNPEEATDQEIGNLSASDARAAGLLGRVGELTGLPETVVWRRLRRAHGRTLVRNVFEDEWPAGTPRAPAPAPPKATLLCGRYALGEKLGEGGFGAVWAATDFGASRPAVRVLKFAHGPEGERSLAVEAERLSDLAHPNICRLYRVEDDAKRGRFLVLQHGGSSLAKDLEGGNRLSVVEAIRIATEVASALDYAHANKVLHLDISPGNVLVDARGDVRVTDFGIAKTAKTIEKDGSHTLVGGSTTVFGNVIYSAPEIYTHGEGRASSDQYSLALVLCTLIEGRVLKGPYKPKRFAALTTKQNAAIQRAASLDPSNRFKSCRAFVEALHG